MKRPVALYMLFIVLSIFIFFLLNLLLGSVHIPFKDVWHILWGDYDGNVIWQNIVWKSRIPQALTALVAGAGLSVSGLQMQTVFRNPLAGPSVLGISSGASMGVAFVVLLSGTIGGVALSKVGIMGEIALTISAIIGSLSIMALIIFVSQKVKGNVTLLIIGVMVGYVANAVIGVLKYFSVEEDIRAYVIWGLGSFARVSGNPDDAVCLHHACTPAALIPAGEDVEPAVAGGCLCPQPGTEYPQGKAAGDYLLRSPGGHRNGLLRSYHLPGTGCSASVPRHLPHVRPPHPDACLPADGRCHGACLQPDSADAGVRRGASCQFGDGTCGSSSGNICFVQQTTQ